ncbi:MAG TPA: metallophosphoesterase family protein [Planctomycetota bacterium]|nr:metallophosphoesterase family protein [Planctomycetota bacterium]
MHMRPGGARLLAIGDIHGCHTALSALLDAVAPRLEDTVVVLGDFVDTGPDSRRVIDRLIALKSQTNLVALLGNHEELMLAARDGFSAVGTWMNFGGDRTLASYAPPGGGNDLRAVPVAHWQFVASCVDFFETEQHIFVHGMCAPDRPLVEQDPKALRWALFETAAPHVSGKIIVCGHTRQRSGLPVDRGFAVCLDTNASDGGWLSCLDVETRKVWQTNEVGQQRTSTLSIPA